MRLTVGALAVGLLIAGCSATPEQRRVMGEAMADGMQRQADVHNQRAAQSAVQVPRRTQCWQNGQSITCW